MSDEEPGRPDKAELPTRSDRGPPADPAGNSNSTNVPYQQLGDFDLLREIGRGGMGVVYEARQLSLKRSVALKVLPPGLGLTDQAVQRFEREAQAAAKLHHTNIIPVYATGENRGCHYYAMELVEGQSLARVLDDLRGERSSPLMEATVTQVVGGGPESPADETNPVEGSTSLSDTDTGGRQWFDTVAKLLADVGDALQYAHDQGVIHRDVKPANLLLSRDGRLCLGDFGLARVAQEPGMTVSGSFLGTPAYMSPEQVAAGRVKLDHRTDVYSLGAVLYEMLTLQRPFPGDSREQILTGILSKEPRPPRRINPRAPVDLETICLKAMEKDPDRRYASAGEMAADLRQYLQRGLIAARRAGPLRRFGKLVRRHPVAATAVVAAILVVALGDLAWQSSRARRQEAIHRALADAKFSLGEGDYLEALNKADEALTLDDDHGPARVLRARALSSLDRTDEAIEEASALLAEHPDDLTARLILATAARDKLGASSARSAFISPTGRDLAATATEQIEAWESELPESSEAYFLRALMAESSLDAVELLDRALELDPGNVDALLERIHRSSRLKRFDAALRDCERLIAARPRSAEGRALMGVVYNGRHETDRALAEMNRAVELDPQQPRYRVDRARIHQAAGQIDLALEDLTAAIELDPGRAASYAERASVLYEHGDFERAAADAQRAVELNPTDLEAYSMLLFSLWVGGQTDRVREVRNGLLEESSTWSDRRRRGEVHAWLSAVAFFSGDAETALADAERALELNPGHWAVHATRAAARRSMNGEAAAEEDCHAAAAIPLADPDDLLMRALSFTDPTGSACSLPEAALADLSAAIELAPDWADLYVRRGELYRELHRFEESLADLERAIELAPSWHDAYRARGNLFSDTERFEAALGDFDRALTLGAQPLDVAQMRTSALVRTGREEEAIRWLSDLERTEKGFFSILANQILSSVLIRIGRVEEALETAERGLSSTPESGPLAWSTGLLRAACLSELPERCVEAQAAVQDFVALASENPAVGAQVAALMADSLRANCPQPYDGELALDLIQGAVAHDPDNPTYHDILGMVLYRNGRYEEARSALTRALEGYAQEDAGALYYLAMASWQVGRKAEAREMFTRGVARQEELLSRYPGHERPRTEAAALLGIDPQGM